MMLASDQILRNPEAVIVKRFDCQPYEKVWHEMKAFTEARHENTQDELWFLEHLPVFTQGQNGKAEHVLAPGDIPVVKTDRGGQITYHGPGQLMVYCLIDLKRKKFFIRGLVNALQQSIIDFLQTFNINAFHKPHAPGVYVGENNKICSIGLRVRRGYVYHGIAFNVDMDLEPFSRINPCGFAQLKMTQLKDFPHPDLQPSLLPQSIGEQLLPHLLKNLRYL